MPHLDLACDNLRFGGEWYPRQSAHSSENEENSLAQDREPSYLVQCRSQIIQK
jgi:hypothetical protein